MKKKVFIIASVVLVVAIVIIAAVLLSHGKKDYEEYIDNNNETSQHTVYYDPSYAPTMLQRVNAVLPELAPELFELGIKDIMITEDNLSYSADTSYVAVMWDMGSYTQYVQITFNEDDSIREYVFFNDLEGDYEEQE